MLGTPASLERTFGRVALQIALGNTAMRGTGGVRVHERHQPNRQPLGQGDVDGVAGIGLSYDRAKRKLAVVQPDHSMLLIEARCPSRVASEFGYPGKPDRTCVPGT